jgi:hypothetical protein
MFHEHPAATVRWLLERPLAPVPFQRQRQWPVAGTLRRASPGKKLRRMVPVPPRRLKAALLSSSLPSPTCGGAALRRWRRADVALADRGGVSAPASGLGVNSEAGGGE